MFDAQKNALKRKKFIRLLGTMVAALPPAGPGFVTIAEKDAKDMLTAEPTFISINPTVPADAEGNVQVGVLQPGVDAFNAIPASEKPNAAPVTTAEGTTSEATNETFEIVSDVPLPSIQRGGNKGGGRESKYPFMKLEIGQSFFVATTPKAFASTLSGGNRRGKKENPIRRFTLRAVDETAAGRGKGIRVWRVDPPAPKAEAPKATA